MIKCQGFIGNVITKVVCIKDKIFDFQSANGGMKLEVKVGDVYLCDKDEYGYYLHDVVNPNLRYPILLGFDDHFCDIRELRHRKLEEIGI